MDHPVVHVDHEDAASYARWASKRLPTEAEWEYAAHGPRWTIWPWGDAWATHRANTAEHWAGGAIRDSGDWRAWWLQHHRQYGMRPATTAVGRFSPFGDSPFGLTDMAGDVAEWTASPYRPYADRSYDPGYLAAMELGFLAVRGGHGSTSASRSARANESPVPAATAALMSASAAPQKPNRRTARVSGHAGTCHR
jgi:formylglycine-generating enzyme